MRTILRPLNNQIAEFEHQKQMTHQQNFQTKRSGAIQSTRSKEENTNPEKKRVKRGNSKPSKREEQEKKFKNYLNRPNKEIQRLRLLFFLAHVAEQTNKKNKKNRRLFFQ